MRQHRRILRRLASRVGLRLIVRRERVIHLVTLVPRIVWRVRSFIGRVALYQTAGLLIGQGLSRREAIIAARAFVRGYL